MGMTQSPTGCNPHTVTGDTPATRLILGAVLPSPFTVNADGVATPNPNLIFNDQAELVSIKPETIVYTLNPKAVWSDGVPVTAADFEYAWTQQRANPPGGPPTVADTAGYNDISSVTGSNKGRTVTVKFRTPFADWKMLFANMLPAHVMDKVSGEPTCTTVSPSIDLSGGPFEIRSASEQSINLRANPHWWGITPNSRDIDVHIATSSNQLAQWMRSGYVQVALPSTVTPAYLTQMASLPNVQSSVEVSATLLQLEFASGPGTRLSPDMREAIALSINRQELVTQQANWAEAGIQVADSHLYVQGQSGYHGMGSSTPSSNSPTTSTSTSTTLIGQGGAVNFPTTPIPQQAAALMTDSGFIRSPSIAWHSAFGVPFTLYLVVDDGDPWAAATAPMIQSELEAAGFSIALYSVQSAAAAGSVLANGYADMALLPRTSSPFLSHTLAWYTMALGPPGQSGSQDWSGYDSSAFEQLVTTASQQLNSNTAAADYAQVDVQLWDNMVALPLFAEPSTLAWSRTLGGVSPFPKSNSLLWYAQFWAVKVPETTGSTTPALPGQ
jgi:peptide/nickel transport system substrate-binding protein